MRDFLITPEIDSGTPELRCTACGWWHALPASPDWFDSRARPLAQLVAVAREHFEACPQPRSR